MDQSNNFNDQRPRVNNTQQILGFTLDPTDLILYFLAFFIPPFPIFVRKGIASKEFLIGLVLWMFFHIPGILYAFYVINDTSLVTGTNAGISSRAQWSMAGHDNGYQTLDVEQQQQHEEQAGDDGPLPEHGIYQDVVSDEEPPTYHESNSSSSTAPASNQDPNRNDTKVFNDNKIQQ